jgi:hypothetical protein
MSRPRSGSAPLAAGSRRGWTRGAPWHLRPNRPRQQQVAKVTALRRSLRLESRTWCPSIGHRRPRASSSVSRTHLSARAPRAPTTNATRTHTHEGWLGGATSRSSRLGSAFQSLALSEARAHHGGTRTRSSPLPLASGKIYRGGWLSPPRALSLSLSLSLSASLARCIAGGNPSRPSGQSSRTRRPAGQRDARVRLTGFQRGTWPTRESISHLVGRRSRISPPPPGPRHRAPHAWAAPDRDVRSAIFLGRRRFGGRPRGGWGPAEARLGPGGGSEKLSSHLSWLVPRILALEVSESSARPPSYIPLPPLPPLPSLPSVPPLLPLPFPNWPDYFQSFVTNSFLSRLLNFSLRPLLPSQ